MRARLIRIDGSTELIDLPEGMGTSGTARKLLGCEKLGVITVIQPGPGRPGLDVWFDEDWQDTGKLPNLPASVLAAWLGPDGLAAFIVGDAIFTGAAVSEGDTLPLTAAQDDCLTELAAAVASRLVLPWRQPVKADFVMTN